MSIIDNSTPLTLNPTQNLQMINTINTNTQSFINCNMLSNSIFITSNTLNIKINTKQDTLTAGTTLLGVGSDISALDYNKITLNKPTIYTQTETNNLLNAKEATLTFSSPLTRTTNTIGINLSSYSTTGTDANYLLKTGGTMTGVLINTSATTSEFKAIQIAHATRITHIPFTSDGKIYLRAPVIIDNTADFLSFGSRTGDFIIKLFGEDYGFGINGYTLRYNAAASASHKFYTGSTNTFTIGDTGNISTLGTITEAGTLLTSKYLQLAGGTMATNANITLSGTGTFTGIHSGNGAALTNLPLSAYSTTGNDTNYLLKTGGTLTGALNGTIINASTNLQEGAVNLTSKYLQLSGGNMATNANITLSGTGTFTGIHSGNGAALTNLPLSAYSTTGNDTNYLLKTGGTLTGALNGTIINASTNLQEGAVNLTSKYLQLSGGNMATNANITLSGTGTFTGIHSGNGAALTNLPLSAYSTTGNDTNYLLKTGGAMTGQITGVTTLNGTTGIFGTISTTNNTNLNTPQLGVYGGTGDKLILYVGTVSVHPYSLGINTNVLWYSAPATASHIFYVAGNPITTISSTGLSTTGLINASTNLQEGGTNLTSKYLKLDGTNTMSAPLNITSLASDNQIVITNTTTTRFTSIRFFTGTTNGYIGIGGAALAGTSYYNNNVFIEANNSLIFQSGNQNTTNIPRMIINTSGNVGIATTNPTELLNLYSSGTNNTFIKADAGGGTGQSGLRLFAGSGATNRATRIDFFNNVASTTSARWSILNDTDQNGTNDFRIYNAGGITNVFTILQSGNVGIGIAVDASYKLNVGGAINAAGNFYSYLGGLRINGFDTGNTIWQGTGDLGISANTGSNIKFHIGNGGEKMRINTSGFVGIATPTPICHLQVIGKGNITNGSEYAVTQNFMASGSLTIGGINTNYGCGTSWNTNTAGLLMECSDNTEIAIHDGNTRVVSAMAYYGGANQRIYIGRDMGAGWGSTPITIPNSLTIDTNLYFTNRIQDHILNLWGTANYSFGINSGTLRYNSDGVHKFYCGGTESSTITDKGIVIGTYGTQYYPFIVNKTINGTLSYVYVRTGWNGGSDYNTNSITGDTSASFAGQIHVSGNILNSSDIRIKKEINDITDDGALQQILSIQPKTYKYIDYLSKGNSNVYGFIAQQVKEVIPHASELVKDIIPNIYKRASCDSNIITLENDVSQDLNLNDNIKIYDEFGNDNMYNITEINSNVIKIDKDINTSNIFVYGKEIEDFHTLKKDYIFTLNVCATQELYKLIQNQNIIIENLQLQINELKNKIIL